MYVTLHLKISYVKLHQNCLRMWTHWVRSIFRKDGEIFHGRTWKVVISDRNSFMTRRKKEVSHQKDKISKCFYFSLVHKKKLAEESQSYNKDSEWI